MGCEDGVWGLDSGWECEDSHLKINTVNFRLTPEAAIKVE